MGDSAQATSAGAACTLGFANNALMRSPICTGALRLVHHTDHPNAFGRLQHVHDIVNHGVDLIIMLVGIIGGKRLALRRKMVGERGVHRDRNNPASMYPVTSITRVY